MLDVCSGEGRDLLPPVVWRKIQIYGTHKIANAATLVRFFDAGPEAVKFTTQQIRFVEQDGRVRKQIEHGAVGAGYRGVELPPGENGDSAGAYRGLDDLFRSRDALAGKPSVNGAQQVIADRSFGERQQQRFVHGVGGTLRGRVEAADRFDLVAEEFDADGALGFR